MAYEKKLGARDEVVRASMHSLSALFCEDTKNVFLEMFFHVREVVFVATARGCGILQAGQVGIG